MGREWATAHETAHGVEAVGRVWFDYRDLGLEGVAVVDARDDFNRRSGVVADGRGRRDDRNGRDDLNSLLRGRLNRSRFRGRLDVGGRHLLRGNRLNRSRVDARLSRSHGRSGAAARAVGATGIAAAGAAGAAIAAAVVGAMEASAELGEQADALAGAGIAARSAGRGRSADRSGSTHRGGGAANRLGGRSAAGRRGGSAGRSRAFAAAIATLVAMEHTAEPAQKAETLAAARIARVDGTGGRGATGARARRRHRSRGCGGSGRDRDIAGAPGRSHQQKHCFHLGSSIWGTWARWAADPSTWFLSELSHPTVVQADGPECPTPGVCHPSLKFSEHGVRILDGLSQIPNHAYPASAVVAPILRIAPVHTWQTAHPGTDRIKSPHRLKCTEQLLQPLSQQ